jgi:TrmH family RNA methyltransferase
MDIISLDNKLVKHISSLHLKKYRDTQKEFIIEGINSVKEALNSNFEIKNILYCPDIIDVNNIDFPMISVTRDVLCKISDTVTPQGIIAVCSIPDNNTILSKLNKILFLDKVQDPGNVGTMIRTADAMGFDAVILSAGSSDPYSLKVVRSTTGSIFHIPLIYDVDVSQTLKNLKTDGCSIYSSTLKEAVSIEKIIPQKPFVLVIGNEGQGISKETESLTDSFIKIEMFGSAESLNASIAAGILMYKFATL